jgi:hypothetical protein
MPFVAPRPRPPRWTEIAAGGVATLALGVAVILLVSVLDYVLE